MNVTIESNAIIEAVARALLDLDETGEGIVHIITWENASARQRKYYIEAAETALAVATPLIRAAALERAALALEQFSGQFLTANMNEHYAALIRTLKEQP